MKKLLSTNAVLYTSPSSSRLTYLRDSVPKNGATIAKAFL